MFETNHELQPHTALMFALCNRGIINEDQRITHFRCNTLNW